MVPVEGGSFSGLQQMAVRWPARLKQAAALCHSLNLIAKRQVVGDLADKQAFKAVEARFQVTFQAYHHCYYISICLCILICYVC